MKDGSGKKDLTDRDRALQAKLTELQRKVKVRHFINDIRSLTDDEQVDLYNALVTTMASR